MHLGLSVGVDTHTHTLKYEPTFSVLLCVRMGLSQNLVFCLLGLWDMWSVDFPNSAASHTHTALHIIYAGYMVSSSTLWHRSHTELFGNTRDVYVFLSYDRVVLLFRCDL